MNKWTEDQLAAIENEGNSLLVSAAAGSGKTAVLVERIIRKVLQKNIPINRFLVLTYTNSAAKEMKDKIIKAIYKEVLKKPSDIFLHEQLTLVHKAEITTVHSFCFNLLRENFDKVGISPDFSVLSEENANLLRSNTLKTVLDRHYLSKNQDFMYLLDVMQNVSSDIIEIYKFIKASADPYLFLDNVMENYEIAYKKGFNHTIWYDIIYKNIALRLNKAVNLSNDILNLLKIDEHQNEKVVNILKGENVSIIQIYHSFTDNNWNKSYEILQNLHFAKLTISKKSQFYDDIKSNRDNYKVSIEEIKDLLYFDLENLKIEHKKLFKVMKILKEIIVEFSEKYDEEKLIKNTLDFNDAEHKVLKLIAKNSEKTKIGEEINSKYYEILVDEYQDTNEIQDTIFKFLSNNEENIFMVGDVKQSIYKFRLADPAIFTDKYLKFANIGENRDKTPQKVVLSKNFRSRDYVLDATNYVFENIMNMQSCGVDYDDDQKLYLGANYYENEKSKAEFHLICSEKFNEYENDTQLEAEYVANKIYELLSSEYKIFDRELNVFRNIKCSDIVILLRSKSKASEYKKMLEKIGISVDFKEGSEKLFKTPEVSLLISMLKVLDNYLLDVDLSFVLKSPIFNFSNADLVKIRNKNTSIYQNIAESDFEKCKKFINDFNLLLEYSKTNSIYKICYKIVQDYNLLPKFALKKYGNIRKTNIQRFLEFTKEYDCSLYDFIILLSSLGESEVKIPSGVTLADSVKIMSIHSSKGLEFPVVFLADFAKQFNKKDLQKNILIHKKLGISFKYVDDNNILNYPSMMQKAIKLQTSDEIIAEEMRILYVAMTRPKEKLFIISTVKNAQKTFEKWLNPDYILNSNSYLDFLGKSIVKLPASKILYEEFNILENVQIDHNLKDVFDIKYVKSIPENAENQQKSNDNEVLDYVPFQYKYNDITSIPSKLTATSFKNELIVKKSSKKPKFLSDLKLTKAEIGTAHHVVMQFINFDKITDIESVKNELLRLFNDKFITKQQFDVINVDKILSFINSQLISNFKLKYKMKREFKFSVLLNASELYDVEIDEKVLLQGVIDCLFESEDGIILVDYKTDYITSNIEEKVINSYKNQLIIYEKAVNQVFNKRVIAKYLYFFENEKFYNV